MVHKGTVTIETPRLVLRRFVPGDLEQIYRSCWSDPEVWKWTNYAPMPCIGDVITCAGMFTEKWLGAYERPNRYSWAMELKATGQVVGRLFGANPDDALRQVELTYELGQSWWNKGLMTEAVGAVIDFFLRDVGFNRVYAYHANGNPASGKVMRKCGMQYEGTARQGCICNGGVFDRVNYAILAEDPRP